MSLPFKTTRPASVTGLSSKARIVSFCCAGEGLDASSVTDVLRILRSFKFGRPRQDREAHVRDLGAAEIDRPKLLHRTEFGHALVADHIIRAT